MMETFNLFSGETDEGPPEASGYRCRAARLGPKLEASRLGMSVYDLPPGEAIGPYHFEWTDEEWLIALAGQTTLRTPEGERVLDPGDVVCFPASVRPVRLVVPRAALSIPSPPRGVSLAVRGGQTLPQPGAGWSPTHVASPSVSALNMYRVLPSASTTMDCFSFSLEATFRVTLEDDPSHPEVAKMTSKA